MMDPELEPGSLPVGDTGENLDTTIVETTVGDVHREAVFVADPINPDARANVVKDLDGDGYSPSIWGAQLQNISDTLNRIEQNQREMFEALINKLS